MHVDNAKVDSLASISFRAVNSNHILIAFFGIETYTISASTVGGGSIRPGGNVRVNAGDSQKFLFTPDAGCWLDSLYVDDINLGTTESSTFHNVSCNHSIKAYFSPRNNAVLFDGKNGSIQFPAAGDLQPQNLTVEMYVRVDSFATRIVPLLWETGVDHWTSADGYSICYEEGALTFRVANASNSAQGVGETFSLVCGEWIHLACTVGNDLLRIYANGNLLREEPYSERIYYGRHGFTLGRGEHSQIGGLNHFLGLMDEVRIWNYCRTPDEIRRTMQQRLAGNENGLVGYWDCDQETGARYLLDRTNFRHSGIIKGNITFVPSNAFGSHP